MALEERLAEVSEDELSMLTELCSDAPYLDIIKITANEMDAFFAGKNGISLAETKRQAWTVSIIWSNMTVTI